MADFPTSFRDPLYASLDSGIEQKLGLPVGMLSAVRTEGERTNADKVSSAGARTPYQIIPATRKAILDQYGIDAYLSPQNAAEAAGLLLRDSLKRNDGDPETAVREYHGGTNPANWGKANEAYWQRVSAGMRDTSTKALAENFGKWMADNPAAQPLPAAAGPAPAPGSAPNDALAAGFKGWLDGSGQIPGTPLPDRAPVPIGLPVPAPAPQPGIADTAIGTGEAALTAATGATGGMIGMIGGTLKGLAEQILSGQFGTPQAAALVEKAAAGGAQALTYSPRTESGQEKAAAFSGAMQEALPAIAAMPGLPMAAMGVPKGTPASVLAKAGAEGTARDVANIVAKPAEAVGMVAPGAAGDAAAGAVASGINAAGNAAARVAALSKEATTLPRRALAALTGEQPTAGPTPGTMRSAGAAGTDVATQRQAMAADLPVPIRLTKGQATRDPAQLKFEVETAKMPEAGVPLRQRAVETNQAILANMDHWIDQTGAEAPSLRATGEAVNAALVNRARMLKTEIRARYAAAAKAGQMEEPVTLGGVVAHLNDAAPDAAVAPLLTAARARALQTGIATEGDGGMLVAQPVPLKTAELYRQAIGAATDYTPTNIRQATIIKGLVDEATTGKGGAMYRAARAVRQRYAQEFEDRSAVSKIVSMKRGTADRQVALEDVFDHSVMKGSLDDVRHLNSVLRQAGPQGMQAWRELQGATLRHIRDEATKSVALDGAGNRVLSPAALDRVITTLDADGKLDFIFGKKGAQQLRDIRELAQIAKTVPPEAAVNMSNTASTLLFGMADIASYGMSGAPVPAFTLGRMALRYIKDAKLRQRINDALQELPMKRAPNNAPGQPISAPGMPGETIH